ncbi:hypothetical protein OG349_19940 [Streptomyces sp. NBC_01317]|uniref:hypothetical protein n=1 Tax=Streptomyces sp. NBC_01317 TaxID=2903822 RepID=UPI002E0FC085|nr:hypothetical protein OG349_19940 [Streptomyces sp. NBC_01317]
MNDEVKPDSVPVPVPEPDSVPKPDGPAPRRRVRRLVTVALPAVLVFGAVAGGITYTSRTVDTADRTAPTTLWSHEDSDDESENKDPAVRAGEGRTDTALGRKLLPVPIGYALGPDVGEFGNDGEFSAKQATALMKTIGEGLSGAVRRDFEKEIDKLGVKGIGTRSYAADGSDATAEIYLVRMSNRGFVHDWYTAQTYRPDARKGPAVKGHKKARCFLAPKSGEIDLEGMECVAYDDDLMVSVVAHGSEPFDAAAIADLVRKQLDHIASPGTYV